jgi:uncharacterized DUF497 family protein
MDINLLYQGQRFVWDAEKASSNIGKHGVSFEVACQVFFDPFIRIEDASAGGEQRDAAIGSRRIGPFFLSSTCCARAIRFASSQRGWRLRRNGELMKTASERVQQRLKKDRPMTVISMRIPEDVIEDLKEIAPSLGFSGYQPLIRAYIGQGLRKDQAQMENSQVHALTESLRKHGIADQVISAAIAEAQLKIA